MSKLGDNSHGNNNEKNFVDQINLYNKNKSLNFKEFIKYICKNENIEYYEEIKIKAIYETNSKLKQDLYIYIDDKKFNISLKMGSGNSVHQEKCEDFIKYIKNEFNATDKICNLWRFFLWADGTLDGKGNQEKDEDGNIKCRFSSREFKTMYPKERKLLQEFIAQNEKKLIEHFLFEGRHGSEVDYIYHGTYKCGTWISKQKIIEYNLNNSNINADVGRCLSVGRMSIQSWNISKKGNSEHKRGQIQIKYSKMEDDFNNLMNIEKVDIGTFEGDVEEFNLSKLMNKNKTHKFWKIILPEKQVFKNYYVVKVISKPKSKLSDRKVFPKSDAYVIEAKIENEFLLEREYLLTEDDLQQINYKVIDNTGISIKLKYSSKYTIQKFTKSSFFKAFSNKISNIEEIFFSLLIYSNEKEIQKNRTIAKDLNIDYEKFINKMNNKYKNFDFKTQQQFFDTIRKNTQNEIIDIIKNNLKLKEAIFTGKHWFENPYYAEFIYVYGEIVRNIPNDNFVITTGSGRSKGKYSIEIKPK